MSETKILKIKTVILFDYTPDNPRNKYHKDVKEFVLTGKDFEDLTQQISKVKNDLESKYLNVSESLRINTYYVDWGKMCAEVLK